MRASFRKIALFAFFCPLFLAGISFAVGSGCYCDTHYNVYCMFCGWGDSYACDHIPYEPCGGLENVNFALTRLCSGITALLPPLSFLLIVSAGVVYASGQLLGAETRARASVWATAMLIGALIGLLIVVVAPPVLGAIYGQSVRCG